MRGRYTVLACGAVLCAWISCTPKAEEVRLLGPAEYYPAWAFDAPFYYKPIHEPTPVPVQREGDPITYFTNQSMVHIQRPDARQTKPEEVPRIAVYYTLDGGSYWRRAGWFGRGQTHFSLQAQQDGEIGIRFVGPSQEPAISMPPLANRVYVVDTTPPAISLTIEPDRTPKYWYLPMETVTVHWTTIDANPVEKPVRVSICWNWENKSRPFWTPIKTELEASGSLVLVVPSEAEPEGFQISVTAIDRLGNVGQAFTDVLAVSSEKLPECPLKCLKGEPAPPSPPPADAQQIPVTPPQKPSPTTAPDKQESASTRAQAKATRNINAPERAAARIELASWQPPPPSISATDYGTSPIGGRTGTVTLTGRKPVAFTPPAPPIAHQDASPEPEHWLARPWQRLSSAKQTQDTGVWRLPS
jgi:hypothetical protein